jgi:ubiquinone/menaquinone biosynthesis C-methylase UbiE
VKTLGSADTFFRGSPTAETGEEYGVKRRLDCLLNATSLTGKVVLDLGCGVGAYGKTAKKYGAKLVVGVDINRDFLLKAKSIERVRASACALPFESSCFELLLMIEVLEHLPSDRKALEEADRVLKRDSLLFVTAPNKFYPFETHGMRVRSVYVENILGVGIPFLSWMPQFLRERVERARIYTIKQLTRLLYGQGFNPLKVDYMMPPLDRVKSANLAAAARKVLGRLEATGLKYFGCHILVVASVRHSEERTRVQSVNL